MSRAQRPLLRLQDAHTLHSGGEGGGRGGGRRGGAGRLARGPSSLAPRAAAGRGRPRAEGTAPRGRLEEVGAGDGAGILAQLLRNQGALLPRAAGAGAGAGAGAADLPPATPALTPRVAALEHGNVDGVVHLYP